MVKIIGLKNDFVSENLGPNEKKKCRSKNKFSKNNSWSKNLVKIYQDEEGRKEDDESKTKIIKNQTRIQSSPLIGPAAPDRHGKEAVTRSKQNATYHEMERLSGHVSEGEGGVLG